MLAHQALAVVAIGGGTGGEGADVDRGKLEQRVGQPGIAFRIGAQRGAQMPVAVAVIAHQPVEIGIVVAAVRNEVRSARHHAVAQGPVERSQKLRAGIVELLRAQPQHVHWLLGVELARHRIGAEGARFGGDRIGHQRPDVGEGATNRRVG